jgi:chromosome partitioning protein
MKVFAVAMQKGGVGKTTVAMNVAVILADRGHRVLIVDADPQHCQSDAFGINPPDEKTLCEVLLEGLPISAAAIRIRGVDLVPGSRRLISAEKILGEEPDGNFRLRTALAGVKNLYDFVFIDCPPNLGRLTTNALVAADVPLVPVQTEQAAANAFRDFYETYGKIKTHLNPNLQPPVIIPSMYQGTTTLMREILQILEGNPMKLEVLTPIRRTIKISEAFSRGVPVYDYDREASGPFESIAERIAR